MQIKRLAISAIIVAATAGLAHLVFSAAAAYKMASYDKRIFDIRQFPDPLDHPDLMGGYLEARDPRNKTVAVGSSFMFGYPFAAELSPPWFMETHAINASIIGLGLQGVRTSVLCEMRSRGLQASRLVVEVPLINEISSLTAHNQPSRGCPESTTNNPTLFGYALRNPIGLQWAEILTDPYRSANQSGAITIAPVPDGYFATPEQFAQIKEEIRALMADTYSLAREVSDEAYLFVTPVYIPGVAQAGRDPDNVRHQFEFAQTVCEEIADRNCISTSEMLDDATFYSNLTHLGAEGAAHLAKLVNRRIQ